ncbi:PepSY domain-containing protein [Pseudoalteromonas luteoviolacea]|uniref:PepSY domain-containing protein n=1 Tax=Pseudoalteromonas luteoviolacea S4054 TaxID=1129367 RepID=A0A0F6ACS2_9GAMM|nr:PepSY domain-containing protein [Pseudoalteromonas luteoviolacea]AOT08818.1 hypothetical protein S4054249_13565 [Pseudoalteromonas luteoviolacea]AOT13731.1 hypothetical protein S40542_13535 [Pseudoalteromonas luteoviolacea]AOT18645.1 hypothetical protein S4054_13540 [Pseudoalteromonas luteoviolacea]KKE83621.1 hypothetical protein N479_13250 [Pseudoalteromonas luteoviolacea S4054]KZN72810.1 hypothetical protein N481_14385 [Pseudoalteromonas luteoviolacea S4047-1]
MLKQLITWHRRIALFCLIPFIIWTLSGLLHPAMSHFAKAPFIKSSPVKIHLSDLQSYTELQTALVQQEISELSHASLVEYNGDLYYQVREQSFNHLELHYLPLSESHENLTDIDYAQYLATKWSEQNVVDTQLITQFSATYPEINRVLPVYQIQLSNGNHVYIDTLAKRITAHNTPLRDTLSYWFKQLHTWQFAGDRHSPWRIVPMLIISIALLVMATFGLIAYSLLWSRIKSKQHTVRSFHRGTGLMLSVCLLGFSSSSTHILIDKFFVQEFRALQPSNQIATLDIRHDPVQAMRRAQGDNFQLVSIGGKIISQIVSFEKRGMRFSYWDTQQTTYDNNSFVRSILLEQLEVSGTLNHSEKIDNFGPTYGFVNKRLPVQQLSFEHAPNVLYSIELHTSYIAAIDDDWQKARSWHFGYLHKYHFLNPFGKGIRDSIVTLICLGLVFVALTGTYMYFSRTLRQRRAKQQRNLKNNELLENN